MTKLPEIYGDTALVTGASSGFGREFARELAREGFKNVVVVARREERLRELAKELGDKYGTNVVVIPQDLSQPGAVNRVVERVRDEGLEVAVLVNNVGVGTHGWFETIDLDKELAMIDINCKVPVELAHHYVRHMKKKGRGGIINLSGLLQNLKAGTFSTYCCDQSLQCSFLGMLERRAPRHRSRCRLSQSWIPPRHRNPRRGRGPRHFPVSPRQSTRLGTTRAQRAEKEEGHERERNLQQSTRTGAQVHTDTDAPSDQQDTRRNTGKALCGAPLLEDSYSPMKTHSGSARSPRERSRGASRKASAF